MAHSIQRPTDHVRSSTGDSLGRLGLRLAEVLVYRESFVAVRRVAR